jgi:hypothetical protein
MRRPADGRRRYRTGGFERIHRNRQTAETRRKLALLPGRMWAALGGFGVQRMAPW